MLQGLCVNGHTPVPWGMTVSRVSSTLHMTEPLLLVQLENFLVMKLLIQVIQFPVKNERYS